jgi:hypothetical protein
MSIPRERPFWERGASIHQPHRDGGPVTDWVKSRRHIEETARRKRLTRRRPDRHLCERCGGFCEDFREPCDGCGVPQSAEAPGVQIVDAGAAIERARRVS